MKKLLVISVLLSVLFPLVISAQAGPPECVKLKRDIKFEGSKCDKTPDTSTPDDICSKGEVVGTANGYCQIIKCNNPADANTCPTNAIADYMPESFRKVILDDNTYVYAWVTERWGLIALINVINTVVDWVFTVLVVLAVLFALLGAYNYLTSAGSPEKTKAGRNYILYAAIGLAVAFIARAIPSLVKGIMGY